MDTSGWHRTDGMHPSSTCVYTTFSEGTARASLSVVMNGVCDVDHTRDGLGVCWCMVQVREVRFFDQNDVL